MLCFSVVFSVPFVVACCDVSPSNLDPPWLVVALAEACMVTPLCGAEGIGFCVAVSWNKRLSHVSLKRSAYI